MNNSKLILNRLDTWRQDTPKMQLDALLGALKGELSNIDDDINPEQSLRRAEKWISQIQQLGKNYLSESWEKPIQ